MGKYDKQYKEILHSSEGSSIANNKFFECFVYIKNSFFNTLRYEFEGKNEQHNMIEYIEIKNQLQFMISICKKLIMQYFGINYVEINKICLELYLRKNKEYGDAWYMNGLFGVFYDLHRKVVRFACSINQLKKSKIEFKSIPNIMDTLIDTIIYCALFIVAIDSSDIGFLSSDNEDIIRGLAEENVEF